MIPESELSLATDTIYINDSEEVELLCVPVLRGSGLTEYDALVTLLKECNEKFFNKQGSVYWELFRFLEKGKVSLSDFIKEIEKKEIELTLVDEGPKVLEGGNKQGNKGPVILSKEKAPECKPAEAKDVVVLSKQNRVDNDFGVVKKVVKLEKRQEEQTAPQLKIQEDTCEETFDEKVFEGTADMEEAAPKAYLIRKSTDEKILITKSVFRIGKDKSSTDYRVDNNPVVSRSHAIITRSDQTYYIVDTNSKNHVFVNGAMIKPNQKIKIMPYSAIRLANEEFTFMIDGV